MSSEEEIKDQADQEEAQNTGFFSMLQEEEENTGFYHVQNYHSDCYNNLEEEMVHQEKKLSPPTKKQRSNKKGDSITTRVLAFHYLYCFSYFIYFSQVISRH